MTTAIPWLDKKRMYNFREGSWIRRIGSPSAENVKVNEAGMPVEDVEVINVDVR